MLSLVFSTAGTICRLRMVSGVPSVLGLEEEKLKHSFHMHRYRCSVFSKSTLICGARKTFSSV